MFLCPFLSSVEHNVQMWTSSLLLCSTLNYHDVVDTVVLAVVAAIVAICVVADFVVVVVAVFIVAVFVSVPAVVIFAIVAISVVVVVFVSVPAVAIVVMYKGIEISHPVYSVLGPML